MTVEWERRPLDWMLAKRFNRWVRKGDRIECHSNGSSIRASLDWAINQGGGECWAIMEGLDVVGVYGWTTAGAIWSYWRDLNPEQIKQLMRHTPSYVLEAVEHALTNGVPELGNFVWEGNREAVAWLRGSHCFDLVLDQRVEFGNKKFIKFTTKPVEDLRRCATQ